MGISAYMGVRFAQGVGQFSALRGLNRVASWIHQPPQTFDAAIVAGDLKRASHKLGNLLQGKTDVAGAAGVLSEIGFQDPIAALAVSDGDPFLLSAALYLKDQPSPSMELLGTLAWCHQRGRLEKAVQLVEDFGVPWLHVRRVTDNLYYERDKQHPWRHQRNMKRSLKGIKKFGIPPHQWLDVFKRVYGGLPECIGEPVPELFHALRTAKRLGFKGSLLWEAAQLILDHKKAENDLIEIKKERNHSSQATIRKTLMAYRILREFGNRESDKIVGALEEAKIPVDQWRRFAGDVRDYGMEALQLSWKYHCSARLVARMKGRTEILERLSKTTLPPQEWERILRDISRRKIQIEDYLTELESWERAGYTWEEHFVFGVLLKQGSGFMQNYPPEVLRLSIEFRGLQMGWFPKFPSTEEPITASQAFDLAKKKYDDLLALRQWEQLPDSVVGQKGAQVYLTTKNRDHASSRIEMGFEIKIFEKGISPIGKSTIEMDATVFQQGDTFFIANIQSDTFRKLSKEKQERWKNWERIFIQFLENWARENGFKRLLISTVFGSTSAHGTLADAAMRNLVNVYLLPRELGYQLAPIEEEWLGTLGRFTKVPRYFWIKDIG